MRKNNWWDHLFNNHHYDFAYAYADPVIEDKKEEEEALFKQFFEWRIGKWFRKITKPIDKAIAWGKKKVVNTVKDVTGITAAENEANRAAKEAQAEAKRAEAEYSAYKTKSDKDLSAAKDKYAAASSEREAQFTKSSADLKAAQVKQAEAEGVGKRTAQYTQQKKSEASAKATQAATQAKIDARAQALRDKRLGKQYSKAPGVASVNIKGPGGVGGTGKPGSETRSAKRIRDKKKSGLNI